MAKKNKMIQAVTNETETENVAAPQPERIDLNETQFQMLLDADRVLAAAQRDFNLIFAGITAAAGHTTPKRLVGVEGRALLIADG